MKIGIALSGGVDSTATALLLRENHDITGFFMELAQPDLNLQRQRVQEVADQLAIPLHCINLSDDFNRVVLNYFSLLYGKGETPNPCVVCNQGIKFGLLQERILDYGMDLMATGHYVQKGECGKTSLLRGVDKSKDQSYFLCRLTREQLENAIFPLGAKYKREIYPYVAGHGFTGFLGNESQDVCFLKETSLGDYLENVCQQARGCGEIVTKEGEILGEHRGLHRYTVGQRRGLGIAAAAPLYVIAIDPTRNQLVVGPQEDLHVHRINLHDLHWIGDPPSGPENYLVKIRSTHSGAMAELVFSGAKGELHFKTPQRAVTPGQYAVFYQGEELVGSGVIGKD